MSPTRKELEQDARDAGIPNPDTLPNKEAIEDALEAPNPALEPEIEVELPQEREYRVTSNLPVLDHNPGETFVATLPLELEQTYLLGGHLKRTGA